MALKNLAPVALVSLVVASLLGGGAAQAASSLRSVSAPINRRIVNQQFPILQMLGGYEGYSIQSVTLGIRGSQGSVGVLINGEMRASVASPYGVTVLNPGTTEPLGYGIRSLAIDVRGFADIDYVKVTLRPRSGGGGSIGGGPAPYPGVVRDIRVKVDLGVEVNVSDRLELPTLVNRYAGMHIVAVEIDGDGGEYWAGVDLLVNNQVAANKIVVGRRAIYTTVPYQPIRIDYRLGSLALATPTRLYVGKVTLVLRR